jgi:hypothetical protein
MQQNILILISFAVLMIILYYSLVNSSNGKNDIDKKEKFVHGQFIDETEINLNYNYPSYDRFDIRNDANRLTFDHRDVIDLSLINHASSHMNNHLNNHRFRAHNTNFHHYDPIY